MNAVAGVLALDVGGTKIAAALVEGGRIVERRAFATPRERGAEVWLDAIADAAHPWRGRARAVGAALTGLVDDGRWSALNPRTLPVPDGLPVEAELSRRLGLPVRAWNDAQAAAWGEARFGAGRGADEATVAFLTISTGIGGGIVSGGRLLSGLAGHFGQWREGGDPSAPPAEDAVSGRWIAAEAASAGFDADARAVFDAAHGGEAWAEAILERSARRAAALLLNVQLALDPNRIVIGGGIGLAPGYLDRLDAALGGQPARLRPRLVPAELGADAGLIGAADLALTAISTAERV